MTDSGRTSNLPHEQGHGQIFASFIERLMLQPDREPVASELGGADDSNLRCERSLRSSTQYYNPSTMMPFNSDSRLKMPLNTLTDNNL
jgi:hypothetical protein